MTVDVNRLATFGDVRRDILETLQMLKRGDMKASDAMAVFAGHKVLNENVQTEINAVKLQLSAKGEINKFVGIVEMGRTLIGHS